MEMDLENLKQVKKSHYNEFVEKICMNNQEYYKKHWEQIAKNPIRNDKDGCVWYKAIKEYILTNNDFQCQKVLEIGCGSGRFLDYISASNYYGLDIYDSVERVIGNRGGIGIHGTCEAIPADDNVFDVCICCEVLEHVENPVKCLEEMFRVLKNHGLLIISVPSYYNLWIVPMMLAKLGLNRFKKYMYYQPHENMFVICTVRKFFNHRIKKYYQQSIRLEPPFLRDGIISLWIIKHMKKIENKYGNAKLKHFGLHTLLWGFKKI